MRQDFVNYLLPSLVQAGLGVLVVVPLGTYYLEPRDFGVAAILNGVAMPIGPLSSASFTWVLSTHFYKVTDAEQKVLVFNVLLGEMLLRALWVVAFALCAPVMLPLIVSGYEPEYLGYFYLMLAATLMSGLWPSISYTVVLKGRSRQHAVMEIVPWLAGALATVVGLTLLKLSTLTLFVSPLVAGLVSVGIGIGYAWQETTARMSRRWLGEILRIGVPSIPANLLESVLHPAVDGAGTARYLRALRVVPHDPDDGREGVQSNVFAADAPSRRTGI